MIYSKSVDSQVVNVRPVNPQISCESTSEVPPDVSPAVSVPPDLGPAKGELGMAFLRRGRVFGQELHDVRVVFVAADAAFADDMHDAGKDVAGAAAKTSGARRSSCLLFLTRVQNLKRPEERKVCQTLSKIRF